ncbi:MAG: hypothetical protein WA004_09720 [Saprospiraceae bacterium]
MPTNLENLQNTVIELYKARKEYVKNARPFLNEYFKEKGRKGLEEFKDSSFLYIRSFDGDVGIRPFSDKNFWNSPDIELSPMEGTETYTTSLEAGKIYNIRCQLHNRGDLNIPFPKVELFLTDPTLGFDTRFARQIGLGQYQGLLPPNASRFVDFTYQIPPSESGHKCLFARTFSFSPLDKPIDVFDLNPLIDRHIGQKNLNIAAQSESFSFSLLHLPNANDRIDFVPMNTLEVATLRHPLIADYKIKEKHNEIFISKRNLSIKENQHELSLVQRQSGFQILAKGFGASIREQANIFRQVEQAVKAINKGEANHQQYRETFKEFRSMNREIQRTTFDLKIPDLGLKKGEATGFSIVCTNKVTGRIKGGITLIVTGGRQRA